MNHRVNWIPINEERPSENLFYPVWIYTPDGVRLSQYVGKQRVDLLRGQSVVDGFVRGGAYFDRVTHWAPLVLPLPPGPTANFVHGGVWLQPRVQDEIFEAIRDKKIVVTVDWNRVWTDPRRPEDRFIYRIHKTHTDRRDTIETNSREGG